VSEYVPTLSKSTRNVLQVLINEEIPLSVDEISNYTKSSKRMTYYNLGNVKYLLKTLNAGDLENKDGGYCLLPEQRERVRKFLNERNPIIDKVDRISYIICSAICSDNLIRLEFLVHKFEISKSAILYDLAAAKKLLGKYQLKLMNSKKNGYYVEGDAFRKRSVFLYYLSQLLKYNSYASLDIFKWETINLYLGKLKQVVEELKIQVEENVVIALSYLLLVMHKFPTNFQLNVADFIMDSKELKIIDRYFAELLNHERIYLMIYLLSYSNNRFFLRNDTEKDFYLLDFAEEFVETFEMLSCLNFENKEELVNSIYLHIKLSYQYYCYSMPSINPLQDEIKDNYPDLFKITELCCMKLKDKFPYLLFESEITYLTMHFGAFMHHAQKTGHANVLLTCLNVTTSSKLLKTEIENQFDNIAVIDTIKISEINSYSEKTKIDFVISTVNFTCKYPIILVHPILTAADKANIASLMMLLNIEYKTDSRQFKSLLDIVKRNVDETVYLRIKNEMCDYLNLGGSFLNIPAGYQVTLLDMMEQYGLQIHEAEEQCWEDAIHKTAEVLLADRCINENYIETIVSLARQHGPYFVISERIAVAHAQPKDGVFKIGVSLSIYKKGLDIIGKGNVQFLFVLATPNQNEHMHILQNIACLNEHPEIMNQMVEAGCEEDVLCILNKMLKDVESAS
jgi:mannitol operon transcriptional antiterminator